MNSLYFRTGIIHSKTERLEHNLARSTEDQGFASIDPCSCPSEALAINRHDSDEEIVFRGRSAKERRESLTSVTSRCMCAGTFSTASRPPHNAVDARSLFKIHNNTSGHECPLPDKQDIGIGLANHGTNSGDHHQGSVRVMDSQIVQGNAYKLHYQEDDQKAPDGHKLQEKDRSNESSSFLAHSNLAEEEIDDDTRIWRQAITGESDLKETDESAAEEDEFPPSHVSPVSEYSSTIANFLSNLELATKRGYSENAIDSSLFGEQQARQTDRIIKIESERESLEYGSRGNSTGGSWNARCLFQPDTLSANRTSAKDSYSNISDSTEDSPPSACSMTLLSEHCHEIESACQGDRTQAFPTLKGNTRPWSLDGQTKPSTTYDKEEDSPDSDFERLAYRSRKKDQAKKSARKKDREYLRAQGLLGKKGRKKANLKDKYRRAMRSDQLMIEIKEFLCSSEQSMSLPPMDAHARKMVHECCHQLAITSRSKGSGSSRHPILYKNSRTKPFDAQVFGNGPRREFGPKGQRPLGAPGARKGSRAGNCGYHDGEVVGAWAPELGVENRGRAMLEKMGWSRGTTLGAAQNNGLTAPVSQVVKTSRSGLG